MLRWMCMPAVIGATFVDFNSRPKVPPQVPKMLGMLRREWAPEALAVSFKLETDEQLLVDKARGCVHCSPPLTMPGQTGCCSRLAHAVPANAQGCRPPELLLVCSTLQYT